MRCLIQTWSDPSQKTAKNVMETEKKPEKDFTEQVDAALPTALALAHTGNVQGAVESLLPLEKQTRGAGDQASNTRLLTSIISICADAKQWKLVNDYVVLLNKKHGFLKHAVQDGPVGHVFY